jgi:hypothetical protein
MAGTPTPFQMSRISIQGGAGAGLLIAVVIAAMLADLPLLRAPTLAAIAGGLILGAVLIVRHRARPLAARMPPLSLDLSRDPRRDR